MTYNFYVYSIEINAKININYTYFVITEYLNEKKNYYENNLIQNVVLSLNKILASIPLLLYNN